MESVIIKRVFLSIVFCSIALLSPVSAHFVCGEVLESSEGMSPAWFSVRMYYPSSPQLYAQCDVSPDENKFCCDADAIPPRGSWEVGKEVHARIFDIDNGHISRPVSFITTGEGYDVFPQSKLEKVIVVDEGPPVILVSNDSAFDLNLSVKAPYTRIQLKEQNGTRTLCDNCTSYNERVGVSHGMNALSVLASDSSDVFVENVHFALVEEVGFTREVVCSDCSGSSIRENSSATINLVVDLSHEIVGMELREYVPVGWNISVDSEATVSEYSQSHNLITWNVSGRRVNQSYSVLAPDVAVLPVKYLFKTDLENLELDESWLTSYNLFSFFPKKLSNSFFRLKNRSHGNINPRKPLVLDDDGLLVALYPKKRIRKAKLELGSIDSSGLGGVLRAHAIKTNVRSLDVDRIFLEFKQNRSILNDLGYRDVELYVFNQSWSRHDMNFSYSDDQFFYYKTVVPSVQGVAFKGVSKLRSQKPSIMEILNRFSVPNLRLKWLNRPNKVEAMMRYIFFYYLS